MAVFKVLRGDYFGNLFGKKIPDQNSTWDFEIILAEFVIFR
jgi:hypothetical protein